MIAGFHNHPPRRLFLERERVSFEAALDGVRQEFGREYPLELGGSEVRTAERMTILNPSHREGTPIGIVHAAGKREVQLALDIAVEAQAGWEARPLTERASILLTASEILAGQQDVVGAWEVHEAAKAWSEALADVDEAIDYLRFYAAAAEMLANGFTAFRPRGVVAVIPPWNFPAAIPCGMTAAALVTGNAVILKPAEQTPLVAYNVVRILHEAGVPPGALQWLPGRGEVTGAALVASRQVDMVAFTGSATVGTQIYRQGSRIRPARGGLRATVAEMGGKNPILVFPDADLDEAVVAILRSAFGHSNQKCSAASRVLIHRQIFGRLRRRLVEGAASLRAGPADEPGTVVTPLIDEDARERVLAAGKRAASEGRVLLPAATPAPGSTLLSPLLVEIDPASAATASTTQEEIFGPVLALVPFHDEREAIALANDTHYALTAGVFSRSPATIARVVAALDAGNIYVNRPTTGARVGVEPFGGHKLSGTGPKAGSVDYLWAFVTSRNGARRGRRLAGGTTASGPGRLEAWPAPPATRARILARALNLLRAATRGEWPITTSRPEVGELHATLETIAGLLALAPEISLPEVTITLPGQQTYMRWDLARGCGLVLTDDRSPLSTLAGLITASLLAGNGVAVLPDRQHRGAAQLLINSFGRAGVPAASMDFLDEDANLSSLVDMPQVTFAAVDAGVMQARAIYQMLANASATAVAPRLKALITLADGPALGEPGFLRRFALPRTVAIRTLHLGAELDLPVSDEIEISR